LDTQCRPGSEYMFMSTTMSVINDDYNYENGYVAKSLVKV